MAFQKTKQYENDKASNTEKALKLLNKIHNTAANYTEYSMPQISFMLQNNGRDGIYYSSREAVVLNVYPLINNLLNDEIRLRDISININRTNINKDTCTYTQLINDYLWRDSTLNNVNIYSFVSNYKKVKKSKKSKHDRPSLKLWGSHEQQSTHELVKRIYQVIPVIIGTKIPSKNDKENHKLYSTMILLLYNIEPNESDNDGEEYDLSNQFESTDFNPIDLLQSNKEYISEFVKPNTQWQTNALDNLSLLYKII